MHQPGEVPVHFQMLACRASTHASLGIGADGKLLHQDAPAARNNTIALGRNI